MGCHWELFWGLGGPLGGPRGAFWALGVTLGAFGSQSLPKTAGLGYGLLFGSDFWAKMGSPKAPELTPNHQKVCP